jgi:O-antigen ligase
MLIYLMRRINMARRFALAGVFLAFILGGIVIAYNVKPLREKVVGKLSYNIEQPYIGDWTGVTIRLAIWKCAWDAVKETPFYGNGTGDAEEKLSESYARNKFLLGGAQNFNAHNQYIESYLLHGAIGLFVLLIVHLVPLLHSFRARNWLMIMFITVMLMGYLTEAILSVQKGVVFFSFFFPLLYLYPGRDK